MDDYADYRIHCEFCNTQYRPKIQGGHPIHVCPNCKATKAQAILMGCFIFLILIGSLNAACYFDSSLGSVRCPQNLIVNNTLKIVNDSREMQLANYFRRLNMTPAKATEQYNQFVGNQAELLRSNTSDVSVPTEKPPALVPANSTTVVRQNRTVAIPRCQNDWNKDWFAYCYSSLQGFDCEKANINTKNEIKRNMEQIRGCTYG